MRSCDSERNISHGAIPFSRRGIFSTVMSIPHPLLWAISLEEERMPAAPISCIEAIRSLSRRSMQHSMSSFSSNGSPICIWGLLDFESSSSSREAKEAPAIPSRPVFEPRRTARSPFLAVCELAILSRRTKPALKAFTSGLSV
ncbi:hypothetical protein SDC9_110823 [bioreactor metagenome]|uniref:Uncharacterized protein n=1 Tax=bioreactor metagenome TaxID=1076179 RepID=A0A645BFT8_9ZZZZ